MMQKKKVAKNQKKQKEVRAPLAVATNSVNRPARFSNGQEGAIIVSHREYVTPVHHSVNFALHSFEINPGMSSAFPWLSHIAHNYETYTFRKLSFEYSPCCPATEGGAILTYMDLDAADEAPTTREDLMQNARSTIGGPWVKQRFSLSPQDLKRHGMKFVRFTPLVANLDIKTYDLGKFYVASEGGAGSGTVGDLFVDYEVEFRTPQYNIRMEANKLEATVVAPTRAAPLGTSITTVGTLPVSRVDGTTFSFGEVGEYLLDATTTGTAITGSVPTLTLVEGAFVPAVVLTNVVNAAATAAAYAYKIKTTRPNTKISMDFNLACTTLTGLLLRFVPYAF